MKTILVHYPLIFKFSYKRFCFIISPVLLSYNVKESVRSLFYIE